MVADATASWVSSGGQPRGGDFRIYAPTVTDVSVLRGVVFLFPGSAGDWRFRADEVVWQEAARSLGFALIGWGEAGLPIGMSEADARLALAAILEEAAEAVGRPELVNAPIVSMGFSWGAFVSTDLACLVPDRVIAVVAQRGGNQLSAPPSAAARKVPILWIPGSLDPNPITKASEAAADFLGYRGPEAPDGQAAFAVDWRTGHDAFTNQGWSMGWIWAAETIALRYPEDELPSTAPGAPLALRDIPLESGWLGQRAYVVGTSGGDRSPFSPIAPYEGYAGDRALASWLPNEAVARSYRAFNSHDGVARGAIPLQGPLAVVGDAAPLTVVQGGQTNPPQMAVWPQGATLTIAVDPREFDDSRAIASMEFHDGAEHLGTLTAPGPLGWSLSHTLGAAGVHGLSVVATDSAGNKTSAFRAVVAAPARPAPERPLLEYRFNGAGSAEPGLGGDASMATMLDANGEAVDLHGASGGGVTGRPEDRAFDNRVSSGMGNGGTGGGLLIGDLNSVESLASFTLQGWFKAASPIGGTARLFDKNSGTGNSSFVLRASGTPGQLVLQVNTSAALSDVAYGLVDEWVFFAVTYDAYAKTGNVRFYVGGLDSPVSPAGVRTLGAGSAEANTLRPNGIPLVAGNNTGTGGFVNNRPFDGLLDNLRVYGASAGARGILGAAELESLRRGDLEAGRAPSLGIGLTDSRPELRWPSRVGQRYRVQRSTDLAVGSWVDLATALDGRDGELWLRDPRPFDGDRVFYRVIVNP